MRPSSRRPDPMTGRRGDFTSERGSPFTTAGFARMVERAGVEAKLGFPAHPHMLRHAVALRWPTRATIRGRCRLTLATATSSTRCDTPSCRRAGSRTSGDDTSARTVVAPCVSWSRRERHWPRSGMKKPPLMPQRRLLSCESQKGHAKPHAERRVATSERRPYPAVLPKFRNPDDPSQTWTGRGKQPRWPTAKLRSGKMVDEFRI